MRWLSLTLFLVACSDGNAPILSDPTGFGTGDTGGTDDTEDAGDAPHAVAAARRCEAPAEGCPCTETGAHEGCGYVYRRENGYVTCSPGFATCQADHTWGPCEGDRIYDGGR